MLVSAAGGLCSCPVELLAHAAAGEGVPEAGREAGGCLPDVFAESLGFGLEGRHLEVGHGQLRQGDDGFLREALPLPVADPGEEVRPDDREAGRLVQALRHRRGRGRGLAGPRHPQQVLDGRRVLALDGDVEGLPAGLGLGVRV